MVSLVLDYLGTSIGRPAWVQGEETLHVSSAKEFVAVKKKSISYMLMLEKKRMQFMRQAFSVRS